MNIKKVLVQYMPLVAKPILWYKDRKRLQYRKSEISRLNAIEPSSVQRIFYLGITEQPNLGDMAQHYCIKSWIKENYPNAEMIMLESSVITDDRITRSFVLELNRIIKPEDIIVFQSGYCTQDLGGDHTLMHKIVCENFPNARILMMPQTIFFQNEKNREACANNHNCAKNMLFLARDMISYEQAQKMFYDIRVLAFPDIVTTLIGTISFQNKRDGICLCTRNDGEKFYKDTEIEFLQNRLKNDGVIVKKKDTQGNKPVSEIRTNLQKFIEEEIESYSVYKLTITDRYHGTIFSLCAGTPVIIIKSTDHKVITGADWFKGIYDDYINVAESLEDAYVMAKKIYDKKLNNQLHPYFKEKYYNNLKTLFEGSDSQL